MISAFFIDRLKFNFLCENKIYTEHFVYNWNYISNIYYLKARKNIKEMISRALIKSNIKYSIHNLSYENYTSWLC